MRLLVTGGSGYLGTEVVRQARAEGWEVVGTSFSRPVEGLVALDVRDRSAVAGLLAEARPQVVVHTAYVQSGPELRTTTVDGAENVARAAEDVRARLIHVSSDLLFCGRCRPAYDESDEPCPIMPYGRAKADAERAVHAACPNASIVRTSLLYGGGTPSPQEQRVLDALDRRADVRFFTDEIRCPTLVDELAAALLELAAGDVTIPEGGRLHVAGSDAVSRYELAGLIAEAYGRPAEELRGASSAETGSERPLNCTLDSSAARRLLKTKLRGVRTVLRPRSLSGVG